MRDGAIVGEERPDPTRANHQAAGTVVSLSAPA
jgi:hypothetical protein